MEFPNSLCTKSAKGWNQAITWTRQCSTSHTVGQRLWTMDSRHEWPRRLLVVDGSDNSIIRLCETAKMERLTLIYMTLSHCWGSSVPEKLLSDNYNTFLKVIELSDLPKTFQDAVEVTRGLDVRYLRIDSLCL